MSPFCVLQKLTNSPYTSRLFFCLWCSYSFSINSLSALIVGSLNRGKRFPHLWEAERKPTYPQRSCRSAWRYLATHRRIFLPSEELGDGNVHSRTGLIMIDRWHASIHMSVRDW